MELYKKFTRLGVEAAGAAFEAPGGASCMTSLPSSARLTLPCLAQMPLHSRPSGAPEEEL